MIRQTFTQHTAEEEDRRCVVERRKREELFRRVSAEVFLRIKLDGAGEGLPESKRALSVAADVRRDWGFDF